MPLHPHTGVNQFHDLPWLTRILPLPGCHPWSREVIMLININLITHCIYFPASAGAELKCKLTLARFLIWLITIQLIYIQSHKSTHQTQIPGHLFCMVLWKCWLQKFLQKKIHYSVGICKAEVEVKYNLMLGVFFFLWNFVLEENLRGKILTMSKYSVLTISEQNV